MAFGSRGILSQLGSISQVNNALVEEVFTENNSTGYILISYVDYMPNGTAAINFLQLNVNRNTSIINLAGGINCLCDIQEGMWIDAIFSSRMTRSIPPQSNAFLILVRRGLPVATNTTTERIISVNTTQNTILTGNPNNINSQTLFVITDNTVIKDRSGNSIRLSGLRPGQRIRIIHANFQTASIPPQTTAFYIQLI